MYDYREWTPEQRKAAVANRIQRGLPWHSPPHLDEPGRFRIITGTCFEHAHVLNSATRIGWFEQQLLSHMRDQAADCTAWVVLSNHYHILVRIGDIREFCRRQGQLHGHTSFELNQQDGTRGRKVWYRCQDRCMRSERHYYTTINYIHDNPVKHGFVEKWEDWPYSSIHWYLKNKGRDWLVELWREYPVLNYGDKLDV